MNPLAGSLSAPRHRRRAPERERAPTAIWQLIVRYHLVKESSAERRPQNEKKGKIRDWSGSTANVTNNNGLRHASTKMDVPGMLLPVRSAVRENFAKDRKEPRLEATIALESQEKDGSQDNKDG
uniref:Uncharacterized protein n=1 Tax=Steinernema glaseri TaxID=37863 RepID=A0A1I7ZTP0_9BILA